MTSKREITICTVLKLQITVNVKNKKEQMTFLEWLFKFDDKDETFG